MKLHELAGRAGARKTRKRIGRGIGSGVGKTGGRGGKGQTARSGVRIKGFEGGQMPLHRRLPKRGFHNIFAKDYAELNLGRLQQAIESGKLDGKQPITSESLIKAGIVRAAKDGVRLLGKGEIKAKCDITVAGASKSAKEAVEKAGGKITLTAKPKKPEEKAA
ncbi:MAG: 50S ribosomal protein L15 [Xanthobacteraceae bacterium]